MAGTSAAPSDRRVGVLVSGSGTNLQALLDDPSIRPHVVLVLSDRPGIRALDRAAAAGVESVVVDPSDHGDREAHTKAVIAELDARGVDVVVSAGYMRILGPEAVERWRGRFLNVHPTLLPSFPGMRGVADALEAGVKVTGVTVHLVDEGVDSGPVVSQEAVEIRDDDTWDTLEERIHAAEHRQLPKAVRALLEDRLRVVGRKVTIDGGHRMKLRALLAVYDKTGIVELASQLRRLGVELVSTGGTAAMLRDAGVEVTPVEDVTGFPQMLDGRVKTLHPRIHASLLADIRRPEHVEQLAEHGIDPFDLLVVNLYPFRETVAAGADAEDVVEKIDIGGPAMVRAAAKNFESVAVVVEPERYGEIVAELEEHGEITRQTRLNLAATAFAHTAAYDAAVAGWFADPGDGLPSFVGEALEKVRNLRYGENPHQRGAIYREAAGPGVMGEAEVLQGKEMSFNNWLDVSAAYDLALAMPPASCVIVKHNNPCGAAARDEAAASYRAAFACDDVSAFGGIVAFHGRCDGAAAEAMADVFTEVVVAEGFDEGALEAFSGRTNLRVVRAPLGQPSGWDIRTLPGGALVQDRDVVAETRDAFEVVSAREPSETEWADLLLAWTVAWRVKSNAIVFVKDRATVGIGAGQMSRVDAAWIAARKAGQRARGAVVASDAFFPFPDALQVAADAGCTAVIHPGGSKGDDAVLAAAEERGMAVVLTGVRHFRH